MMLNILLLCIPFLANAATLEADELGNIVAAVSEGNKVLIQEGTNPPVDLVNEAKLAQEGIKLARRETSENAVCDTALTGVVDQVATMVTNLAALVKTTTETLAGMANSTAAANANAGGDSSSTSGTVTENAVAAQQAARQMKQYMTCMEYKIADPSLKSGVYVLSACDSNVDPSRRTCQYMDRGSMKVYCDMETDGGGWMLVMHESHKRIPFEDIADWDGRADTINDDVETAQYPKGRDGEQYTRPANPQGRSFKFDDKVINDMRTKKNQLSYIGYRITSNDNDVTYFGHEDCAYQHLERADKQLDPCRRYTTKIDAKSDEWIQCLGHSDWGGLDCWYGCGNPTKEGHTTRGNKGWTGVFFTANRWNTLIPGDSYRGTAMDPDNKEGKTKHDANSRDYKLFDDVLLWIR